VDEGRKIGEEREGGREREVFLVSIKQLVRLGMCISTLLFSQCCFSM